MQFNNFLLRIALVLSYCLIDYTLAQDLLGGRIIEILVYFLTSGELMLTAIAAIYFACLIIWLTSPLLTRGNASERKLLVVVSVIMVLPLIANVILLLSQIGIQFILWSAIFCILLYLNLRLIKK